jgi:hypothetical protein
MKLEKVVCFRAVLSKKNLTALDPQVFAYPCYEEGAQSLEDSRAGFTVPGILGQSDCGDPYQQEQILVMITLFSFSISYNNNKVNPTFRDISGKSVDFIFIFWGAPRLLTWVLPWAAEANLGQNPKGWKLQASKGLYHPDRRKLIPENPNKFILQNWTFRNLSFSKKGKMFSKNRYLETVKWIIWQMKVMFIPEPDKSDYSAAKAYCPLFL